MDTNEKQTQIDYWLTNRKHAMSRGQFREVKRINKILSFYGHKAERDLAF